MEENTRLKFSAHNDENISSVGGKGGREGGGVKDFSRLSFWSKVPVSIGR